MTLAHDGVGASEVAVLPDPGPSFGIAAARAPVPDPARVTIPTPSEQFSIIRSSNIKTVLFENQWQVLDISIRKTRGQHAALHRSGQQGMRVSYDLFEKKSEQAGGIFNRAAT